MKVTIPDLNKNHILNNQTTCCYDILPVTESYKTAENENFINVFVITSSSFTYQPSPPFLLVYLTKYTLYARKETNSNHLTDSTCLQQCTN